MRLDSFRSLSILLLAPLFALLPPVVAAQTVSVQNGTTVQVQNGTAWSLEDGTMDFGPSGSTARLNEQGTARVTGGQLTATRALSTPSAADPVGLGLQITASEDLGDVTVTRGHTVQTAPNSNESIERYYDVSPSQNNSGLSAELTFTYHEAELDGIAEAELEFFKSEDGGSHWSEEGFDSRDMQANTATLSNIESLSRWTLGSESAPLPVELAGFVARTESGVVRLKWQTTSETGNAGFEVQRQRAGTAESQEWTQVGFVEGAGTTSEPKSYQFTDEDLPYEADLLSYRLKQVDTDGSTSLSKAVRVARQAEALQLKTPYPNPAQGQVTIRYAVPRRREVTLSLHDILGRRVRTVVNGEKEGRLEKRLDVSSLSSGTYFLRLRAGEQTKARGLTVVR